MTHLRRTIAAVVVLSGVSLLSFHLLLNEEARRSVRDMTETVMSSARQVSGLMERVTGMVMEEEAPTQDVEQEWIRLGL